MFKSKMYIPSDKLKEWIKVFWFLEGTGKRNISYPRNLLPDGCATILFVLDGSMDLSIYKNGLITRGIYVIPPVISAHRDLISDNIYSIDVQLNPSVFYKLFNIPINELKNTIYTFDELSLNFDINILEKISKVKDDKNQVYTLLNEFFTNLFYKQNFYSEEIITNINQLYKNGNLSQFFDSQNLSIRQIERKVKKFTGLTPQNIARMGRFYSVLDYMKFREFNMEFCELAFEHKFSDQSHFIREFKSFTNETPSKFLKDLDSYPQFRGLCNITKIIN